MGYLLSLVLEVYREPDLTLRYAYPAAIWWALKERVTNCRPRRPTVLTATILITFVVPITLLGLT